MHNNVNILTTFCSFDLLIEHSHQTSQRDDKHTGDNINVRAAFIHVLGDLVQSIGVLIAAYIIYYKVRYNSPDNFMFAVYD